MTGAAGQGLKTAGDRRSGFPRCSDLFFQTLGPAGQRPRLLAIGSDLGAQIPSPFGMDFQEERLATGWGGEEGMVVGEMLEPSFQLSPAAGWRLVEATEDLRSEAAHCQGEGQAGVGQAGQDQRGAVGQEQPRCSCRPEPAVPGPSGLIEGRLELGSSPPRTQPLGGQKEAESSQSEPIWAGRHAPDSIRPDPGHEESVFPA